MYCTVRATKQTHELYVAFKLEKGREGEERRRNYFSTLSRSKEKSSFLPRSRSPPSTSTWTFCHFCLIKVASRRPSASLSPPAEPLSNKPPPRRPPSQPREAKKCHNLSNTGKERTCPPNPAVLCTHTRVICPFDDQRRREEKPMAPTGKRATRSDQRRVQAACSIARRQNT